MNNNTEVPFYRFWAETFLVTIDEARHAYTVLHELVSDTEFIKTYLTKKDKELKDIISKDKSPTKLQDASRILYILSKHEGINNAYGIFNRQTLVTVATIIESMLDEFFLSIFCASPEKMYEYIQADDDGKHKGKIDIKDLINSPSRTELLLSLAKQPASKAMQGEFKSAIKRLKKLTIGEEFSASLSKKLIDLNKTRNEIVHELTDIKIQFDDVKNAFETAFELVEYLEKIAKRLGIPVEEIDTDEDEEEE